MRVTYLLVAFLAGARSFKAVERRAKPMGKGGGGVVARSVVEAAIQALALDDKIAARSIPSSGKLHVCTSSRRWRGGPTCPDLASTRSLDIHDESPRRWRGGRELHKQRLRGDGVEGELNKHIN